MGIKGVYRELGPGQRVSLSKLAVDGYKTHDRPLRLAIDIAIWQFQTQAARGGTNPAIRTLFNRLIRLLGTPIQPVFVFDGPRKPAFKRNKRSGRGDGVATALAKRLIQLFGFATHDAPGEAEAECALLQRNGIVDAVLSEDVDTIMFGCTRTLRNWSAEGKGSKTPTHVTMYDIEQLNTATTGLDREGMVLVAMMSGGDYLPDGIAGCGVKVACEAAKAGFGKSLCSLKASDSAGLRTWKDSLTHELRTNEGGHFRTKHKALIVPETFPNLEVLRYYTHPAVSPLSSLDAVRARLQKTKDPDILGLRDFTREIFNWEFRTGAIYFVRRLAPALLVHKFCQGHPDSEELVKRISARRTHFSTDATPELRIAFIPQEIVPIDVSEEPEETAAYGRDGLALNSDDDFEVPADALAPGSSQTTGKVYDVSKPDLVWVLEEVARKTIPKPVLAWEEAMEAKAIRKSPTKKSSATQSKRVPVASSGGLDRFVKITKATAANQDKGTVNRTESGPKNSQSSNPRLFRRLRTPPREPSKQPSTDGETASYGTPGRTASSHILPRTPDAGNTQPILISSSPPVAPSPPSPSPGSRFAPRNEDLRLIRPKVFQSSSQTLNDASRGKRAGQFTPRASQTGRFKQTTMDMFATRNKPGVCQEPLPVSKLINAPNGRLTSQRRGPIDEAIEINTSPMSPPSPASPQPASPSKRDRQRSELSPSPSPRVPAPKKLLIPRTSAVGFFREVEVEEHEVEEVIHRETSRLRKHGIRSAVTRWSDVSVIDLTQES
ncbi:Flap endonuclease [Paramyrothecium foliicola]|nr:Flap endonuclease [Paramyrothecium foliicola]